MLFIVYGLMAITLSILASAEPILIMTHNYIRPDFIEIQKKTFKKFLKDDYEFVVFNDAPGEPIHTQINETCARLGIRCIRIPQRIHTYAYLYREPGESFNNPCVRCANVVQYSLNELGFKHNGIVVIIDADMFLVKELSITKYMYDYDIAGAYQSRGNKAVYFWNGLVFLNIPTLPNKETISFNCGRIEGEPVDVGGYTHHYLKNNPTLRKGSINIAHSDGFQYNADWLKQLKLDDLAIEFVLNKPHNVEFLLDGHFMHYRGGGNWDNKSPEYHRKKTDLLQKYVMRLLA